MRYIISLILVSFCIHAYGAGNRVITSNEKVGGTQAQACRDAINSIKKYDMKVISADCKCRINDLGHLLGKVHVCYAILIAE